VASDMNPLHLQTLGALRLDRPYLETRYCDVSDLASFPGEGGFDTVICLNVVEHVDDDVAALRNVRAALAPDGRAVVLVPQGPDLFGTLDQVLGHRRRYTEASLRAAALAAGLEVVELVRFNRVGTPAWWLNGKLLKRRGFGLLQVWALNALTPLFRLIDGALPFAPLSLIAVLRAAGPAGAGVAAAAGPPAAAQG
jgi:SAM-dependent methyltransferase